MTFFFKWVPHFPTAPLPVVPGIDLYSDSAVGVYFLYGRFQMSYRYQGHLNDLPTDYYVDQESSLNGMVQFSVCDKRGNVCGGLKCRYSDFAGEVRAVGPRIKLVLLACVQENVARMMVELTLE